MPSWNRREKPDYRHLRDATPESALLGAIRSTTYGEDDNLHLLNSFQGRLTAMWGDRDVLAIDELVAVHEDLRARDPGFAGHGKNWQGAFLHDVVGNLVGWDLHLGILVEDGTPERRAFRMVRRDPLFDRMGDGRWRRLDAEGVRERMARGAGQREAARVKHAEKVAPRVAELVGTLCELGAPVPDRWFAQYPDQFARLKGLVERVADARPTFEDAHRGMHLADHKRWIFMLDDHIRVVRSDLASDRRAGRPPRYGAPEPAALPAEDLDALDGL